MKGGTAVFVAAGVGVILFLWIRDRQTLQSRNMLPQLDTSQPTPLPTSGRIVDITPTNPSNTRDSNLSFCELYRQGKIQTFAAPNCGEYPNPTRYGISDTGEPYMLQSQVIGFGVA